MVIMTINIKERTVTDPASPLLSAILATASGVHYQVRDRLWRKVGSDKNQANNRNSGGFKQVLRGLIKTIKNICNRGDYGRGLYDLAEFAAERAPYNIPPRSHTGVQCVLKLRNLEKLEVFQEVVDRITNEAKWLFIWKKGYYTGIASQMLQNPIAYRKELIQVYPCYSSKENRTRNNIPEPTVDTLAPLLMIQDKMYPLNDRGQFARLIIESAPISEKSKESYIKSLKEYGWISGDDMSTTNASMASVREVGQGNYVAKSVHMPHRGTIPPATAA